MIINYPTGFYATVLPKTPSDSQSVTYLISTTTPPRTSLLFPKIPVGVSIRKREPRQLGVTQRRQTVSDLIFTVSKAVRQQPGNNAKQYEIGDILSFTSVNLKTADLMLVADKTIIQHNLNMFDYAELGLTEEDVALIDNESQRSFMASADRLNGLRVTRANAEIEINTQQKIINEADKNIAALGAMVEASDSTGSDIVELIDKLRSRKQAAEAALKQAVDTANECASDSDAELSRMRAIAMVLK